MADKMEYQSKTVLSRACTLKHVGCHQRSCHHFARVESYSEVMFVPPCIVFMRALGRYCWIAVTIVIVCLTMARTALANDQAACGEHIVADQSLDEETCDLLDEYATTSEQQSQSLIEKRRAAKRIALELEKILVSRGYYTAAVIPLPLSQETQALKFRVNRGLRFKVEGYVATFSDVARSAKLPQPKDLDIKITNSSLGIHIVEVQEAYLSHLRNHGYPFAMVTDRVVDIRKEEGTANVRFKIDEGELCIFGPVEIEGLQYVEETYIRDYIDIAPGDLCSLKAMQDQKAKLAKTGLLSSVDVKPDRPTNDAPKTPIKIHVVERPHRTIGAGLSYESNVGFGGQVTWEHRNLLRRGEKLRLEAKAQEISQSAKLEFRKRYQKRNVVLFGGVALEHDTKDAFDASQINVHAGYERPFLKDWRLTYAVEVQYSEVEAAGVLEKGVELSLPTNLKRGVVDNGLDPRKGYRLALEVEPVQSAVGDGVTFVRLDGRGSKYIPVDDKLKTSVALWGHVGSTFGAPLSDIPATRRYYGGGSQSVRAIEYERLGEIAVTGAPIGGRSILEGGVEVRSDITENWGVAVFAEGGLSSATELTDIDGEALWGGGIGLRYRTPIGPLRIDVATPFNPRSFDDQVQFYIGLGQAF